MWLPRSNADWSGERSRIMPPCVNRDMMTALTGGKSTVFFHNVVLIVVYSLVAAPITAVDGYVQGRLMRQASVDAIHTRPCRATESCSRSGRRCLGLERRSAEDV